MRALCRRTAKFYVVTHVGEGHVSWGQPRLPARESGVSVRPNFWVVLHLCLHRFTQNDQIRHGNMYGEGSVSGDQPRHYIEPIHPRSTQPSTLRGTVNEYQLSG